MTGRVDRTEPGEVDNARPSPDRLADHQRAHRDRDDDRRKHDSRLEAGLSGIGVSAKSHAYAPRYGWRTETRRFMVPNLTSGNVRSRGKPGPNVTVTKSGPRPPLTGS